MTELGDFSSLFIVHCVFNGFLSYTCTVLNIVTIHALRKTPSLTMTLKALLLIELVCIIATALFYWRIYLSARLHTIQINRLQVHQAQQNGEVMANTARQRKCAVGAFYVFLVLLTCYLPMLCVIIADLSTGLQSTLIFLLKLNANTLVLPNSSLNPLIYSWKMRHIRRTITNLLRNVPHRICWRQGI